MAAGEPRVLFLIDRLEVGGPARVMVSLVKGLLGRGLDVRAAHLGLGNFDLLSGELLTIGAPLLNLRLRSLLDPRPALELAAYLRRENIDLVHTHNRYAHIVGRMAAVLAGRPAVSTIHNIVDADDGLRGKVRRQLDYSSARAVCAAVITVCEAQRQWYVRVAGVEDSRLSTHFNGVDTALFRPDPQARASTRASLGLSDDERLFVTVGVLRAGKGLQYLLEAAVSLRQYASEARVAIVGDGPERDRLEADAARLGLRGSVQFLGASRDVPAILSAADVYVQPSLFEALPTSVLEAMAAGLPVVATHVGGLPEIISHGHTGLLVQPMRPDELAMATACLLDPELRASMGKAARAWVQTHASLPVWLDKVQDLYRQIVGAGPASRSAGRNSRVPP